MEIYQGVVLGILQGLTEFLPVSSSGHLVMGQHFFNMTEPMLAFDISVHLGTLAAVIIIFYRDIKNMAASIFNRVEKKNDFRLFLLILAGSIPTAVLGLGLKKIEHLIFSSVLLVGCMLILTGIVLWLTKRVPNMETDQDQGRAISNISFKSAVIIGTCQGVAVIPGISRSGSTIAAGLFAGLDRKTAGRFSFLLSIPAIMGAELLHLAGSLHDPISINSATLFGTLAAFITGYAALLLLLRIVNKGKLHIFAPYCWLAGSFAIIYHFI